MCIEYVLDCLYSCNTNILTTCWVPMVHKNTKAFISKYKNIFSTLAYNIIPAVNFFFSLFCIVTYKKQNICKKTNRWINEKKMHKQNNFVKSFVVTCFESKPNL